MDTGPEPNACRRMNGKPDPPLGGKRPKNKNQQTRKHPHQKSV
jgi:hypothetical protein